VLLFFLLDSPGSPLSPTRERFEAFFSFFFLSIEAQPDVIVSSFSFPLSLPPLPFGCEGGRRFSFFFFLRTVIALSSFSPLYFFLFSVRDCRRPLPREGFPLCPFPPNSPCMRGEGFLLLLIVRLPSFFFMSLLFLCTGCSCGILSLSFF